MRNYYDNLVYFDFKEIKPSGHCCAFLGLHLYLRFMYTLRYTIKEADLNLIRNYGSQNLKESLFWFHLNFVK